LCVEWPEVGESWPIYGNLVWQMVADSSVVIESKMGRGVIEIGMLLWLHNQWHHLQHHGLDWNEL
jgi:hypothetical protein